MEIVFYKLNAVDYSTQYWGNTITKDLSKLKEEEKRKKKELPIEELQSLIKKDSIALFSFYHENGYFDLNTKLYRENETKNRDLSILHVAVDKNAYNILEYCLIKKQMYPDHRDMDGLTPLNYACAIYRNVNTGPKLCERYAKVIKLFIENQALIDVQNSSSSSHLLPQYCVPNTFLSMYKK